MIQGIIRSNSIDGIIKQHFLKQIKSIGIQISSQSRKSLWGPSREGRFEIWEFRDSIPNTIFRGSKNSKDFENLIYLRIPSKERFSLGHFKEYTADRPDINRSAVLSGS